MMCPMTRPRTLTLVIVAAGLAMSGCAPSPEPIDRYEAAHTMCWATQDQLTEHHQPDAAEAWHRTNEKVCTTMAEEMGEEAFIDFWLDKDAVAEYIKDQW